MKMNTAHVLRQQGIAYSIVAIASSLLIVIFPAWNSNFATALLAILIFILGFPHGALDIVFAKQLYRLVSWRQWAVFCLAYVTLAAAVVGFWWVTPSAFLVAFLLVSAFHFSGDLKCETSAVLRFWYAPSMLIFPTWLHEADVARLFGNLVAGEFSVQLASILHGMVLPWCVGLSITLVLQWRSSWVTSLEVVSVSLLAAVAPPLLGFTIYFCVMHSARHALRTLAYAAHIRWTEVLKKAIAPMSACALAGLALSPALADLTFETAVVQILFVGLAALTVPHMILINQVRQTDN